MIYELAVVARPDATEDQVASLKKIVSEVTEANLGSVLLSDDWGTMRFPQPTSSGLQSGNYLYFIYKSDSAANKEIQRRLGINESVIKYMFVKLGEASQEQQILKNYKTPFSKAKKGTEVEDTEGEESEKGRKKFAKRKNCWFTSNKLIADWKDPNTYAWLVNEFGKIGPARVSGVSRKHQRFVNTAIKRARQIGVASYMNNRIAERI
ncbi:MAG: 30S ribosomal protein S18 [Halobacteriovoraceae bacterium]|nr:30S ribosomal protein S18 [Halobacteriovoraceae bacterium]